MGEDREPTTDQEMPEEEPSAFPKAAAVAGQADEEAGVVFVLEKASLEAGKVGKVGQSIYVDAGAAGWLCLLSLLR